MASALTKLRKKPASLSRQSFGYWPTYSNLDTFRGARESISLPAGLATLSSEHATSEAIRRVALPFMLRLRDEFGETINLGVLRLDKVKYIEVVPSEYALRFSEKPGSSVEVHASALGKVLLAYASPEVVQSLIGEESCRCSRGTRLPIRTNLSPRPIRPAIEAMPLIKKRHRLQPCASRHQF
jgi:DNA-binding IclR family transcriptional regulator